MVADVAKDIAFDKVLGQKVTVRLNLANGKPRYFSGICNRFSQGEADKDFCTYHLDLVPQFWLLTRVAQTRVFQQQSVPDILKAVFKGLDPNVTYQLTGQYQPRNYCVQYRETDFDFACRLMEEEGIFYFFTHAEDGHKMIVGDSPQSHPELPLASKLTFEKMLQETRKEDRVLAWHKRQELLTGQFMLWDHCFELPGKNLQAKGTIDDSVQAGKVKHQLKAGRADGREVYDYPGFYAVRFDGVNSGGSDQAAEVQKIFKDNERTVGIRQQQEAVRGVVIDGTSTIRQMVSGHKFTLEKHAHADGSYLVTAVKHEAVLTVDYRTSAGGTFRYSNTFDAIPFAVPFRPARITPRPFVQGTHTATVVGPAGQEIFTDKYGRVKVQFHWDREGKRDAKSSCWVRVAQVWAGKRWGASFWPRIGQEVVVAFLEGNPDWPIIVGSVYNAEQMPPYLGDGLDSKHPKDNKVSGVKSNSTPEGKGFNEWRFDDTKDKEQIFIHAQRNLDVTVNNDALERIYANSHSIIGVEKDGSKSGDRYEMVYQDRHIDIKRDQIEQIEGNLQLTVGKGDAQAGGNVDVVVEKNVTEAIGQDVQTKIQGNRIEQVAKDQSLTVNGNVFESIAKKCNIAVSGDRNEKIGGAQSLNVGSNQNEKVGQNHALEAGANVHIKGGANVVIEAGAQLTLKVGGNFVVIGPDGVSIMGTMVKINSGGAAGSGSGASPTAPDSPQSPADAKQAKPTKPTVADDSKSGNKSAPS
jgi:type VI secretion system secreted protein VgrG